VTSLRREGRLLPRWGILSCLAGSAFVLAVAPAILPAGYSWIAHTTSEAAAQGVEGAWLSRLGFLVFGLAVLWLAGIARGEWGWTASFLHSGFGILMVAAAVFSARAWDAAVPFDPVEDVLHSVAATAMGFAFALGVFALVVRRVRMRAPVRWLDLSAIAASIVIPTAMIFAEGIAGVLQRGMFLVAYTWYGLETVRVTGGEGVNDRQR